MIRTAFICFILWSLTNSSALHGQPEISSGIVHASGVDLAYEAYNLHKFANIPPIIVANGGPGISHHYLTICPAWKTLARTHPVIFYDQRGTGKSVEARADLPQGMPAQVQDLEALRAELGFDKIDLIGHSWGGQIAMGYASVHPEHINSLILVDSGDPHFGTTLYLFDQVYPDVTADDSSIDQQSHQTPEDFQASLQRYFSMLFYSKEHHDAFIAALAESGANQHVGEAVSSDMQGVDLTHQIGAFRFPVLIITGRFDTNIAPVVAWKIHKRIPGSKFIVYAKSGHLPFYEEPELFVKDVNSFLKSHD